VTRPPISLGLRLKPGAPTASQVDVDADGTTDFSLDRDTLHRDRGDAGAGDDTIRIDQSPDRSRTRRSL
jgi:hypothetical protein